MNMLTVAPVSAVTVRPRSRLPAQTLLPQGGTQQGERSPPFAQTPQHRPAPDPCSSALPDCHHQAGSVPMIRRRIEFFHRHRLQGDHPPSVSLRHSLCHPFRGSQPILPCIFGWNIFAYYTGAHHAANPGPIFLWNRWLRTLLSETGGQTRRPLANGGEKEGNQ